MGVESVVNRTAEQMLLEADIPWFAEQLCWERINGFRVLVKSIQLNRGNMAGLATDMLKEYSGEGNLNIKIPEKVLYTGAELWLGDDYALSIFKDNDNLQWPYLQNVGTGSFEDIINQELGALEKPPRTKGFMGVKNLFLYILTGGTRGIPCHAQSGIVANRLYQKLKCRTEE